ncbi:MAG: amidohydrolase family protein [Chloroflexota bacterium]|nr:amidohydrolase family protein [Chloroflexota bacterium]MDE2883503.1 amidohydrolase family protein [Chloroflexota bacterium]
MPYDLLLKNGRVVDGTGGPSYEGDVAVVDGRIAETGRLGTSAKRVIDVQGQVIAPGFIDNHCHYDAQVLWDPLCTFACYHGATTVINGNCSLGLAPARPEERADLVSMLSRVEAIPVESLQAGVEWSWETVPQYLETIDRQLGVNVGSLIGFSAVRRHVMGEAAYSAAATPEQIEQMKEIVREGIRAGALGLSSERNLRHMDLENRLLPANAAPPDEFVAVAEALAEVGAGSVQFGDSERIELSEGLLTRVARATGRPVISSLAGRAGSTRNDARMYAMVSPFMENTARWTLLTVGSFDGFPHWLPVMSSPPEERRAAFQDSAVRAGLRADADAPDKRNPGHPSVRWDLLYVARVAMDEHRPYVERSVADIAAGLGKDPLDAFLDLALKEDLKTLFYFRSDVGTSVMAEVMADPFVLPGLSDGGAHVTRRCDSHFSTFLLSFWVRQQQALSLEEAVRKLTFMGASAFGLHDRGLIRPGLAGDLTVFDPDTIGAGELEEVADYPGDAVRMRRPSEGVACTIVNGEVLIEAGEHTGALPGQLLRSSAYRG